MVDERTPVLFIVPSDEIDSSLKLMDSLRKFGASVISISEKKAKLTDVATDMICVSEDLPKLFSPILYVIPLQLFAYYSSIARGLNPDKPEKLVKVVK